MKPNHIILSLCFITMQILLFAACSGSNQAGSQISASHNSVSESKQTNTAADIQKEQTPVEADTTLDPINRNESGKTVIRAISRNFSYPNNSYMIISKSGTVIAADASSPQSGIKPDIITATHSHSDHLDSNFIIKNTCKKSLSKVESFSVKDAKVFSVASTHMGNDINTANFSNVIYVYEVDGLRIAHMGDIGQDQVNDDQLKLLGNIDIAFMQFINAYSDYSLENEKGFKLIEQLKPQVIIPTHSSEAATKKISDIVGAYESVENVLTISKEDLKDGKRKVIEIKNIIK